MEPKPNLNRLLICSIEKKVVRLGTTLWDKHGYPIPLGSKGKATFFQPKRFEIHKRAKVYLKSPFNSNHSQFFSSTVFPHIVSVETILFLILQIVEISIFAAENIQAETI